jgi:CHAD domain-containing protein
VARARTIEGLDCSDDFAAAAAVVVGARAAEVFEHSQGVLDLDDPEALHDMRVATRRLRAALEMFRPCFEKKQYARALKMVKALADALGERRDRDVAIDYLSGLLPKVEGGERRGLELRLAELRVDQLRANQELASYLEVDALERLRGALAKTAGVRTA